jgi:hypothetical protein
MARGSLPAQTPEVPAEMFVPMDLLYRHVSAMDRSLRNIEGSLLVSNVGQASSTVLLPQLQFTLALRPKDRYRLTGQLIVSDNFKFRHSGPAAPDLVRIARKKVGSVSVTESLDTTYSAADHVVSGEVAVIMLDGIIHNGNNSGLFEITWAQQISSVTPTILYAGSHIAYSPIV